ncbi:MlaD family protein [Chitinimonas koreensis]|nr:MlaD family protein [Chitinimonas koreensis]
MKDPDRAAQRYRVYFEESLRGLSVGAPIDLRGLPLGEVRSFGLEYDAARRRYRFPVEIALYPERLHAQARGTLPGGEDGAALLDDMVAKGLRAQLRSGNLLTGQMHVALDFFPKAPAAAVDRSGTPWVLPSTPGSLGQLQDSVANIVKKVERIPFEELAGELRRALGDLDGAIKDAGGLIRRLDRDLAPPAAAALQQAERTLQSAERVLAQDAPLQQDLRGTLGEVKRAADSLRNLTDYLERHPESLLRGKPEDPK